MKKVFIFIFILKLFIFCKEDKKKVFSEELNNEEIKETYDILDEEEIEQKLSLPRKTSYILSKDIPKNPRLIAITRNQEKITWVQDNKLYLQEIYKLNLKEKSFKSIDIIEYPNSFSISDSGWFVLVEYNLKKKRGCRLIIRSFDPDEKKMRYESGANMACKNKASISNDGSKIYYFLDNNLYEEETKEPSNPILIAKKKDLIPPYPKLKFKFYIYPIDSEAFIIFSGNAGAYNLYYFNPTLPQKVRLITKEVLTYKYYYANEEYGFFIKGVIGSMFLWKLKYEKSQKPKINRLYSIGRRHSLPWKTKNSNEFLSGNSKEIYLWKPMKKRKVLPILCKRFWLVRGDYILCENSNQSFFLQNMDFSTKDWELLSLYQKLKDDI